MGRKRHDTIELGGEIAAASPIEERGGAAAEKRRRFLAIWFRCCHAYGRLYRNPRQTAYVGRCPRCGAAVSARIGPQGTKRRFFEAR